jgi:hypothetical protein
MARRLYDAVGGVDRLVGERAGQAGHHHPEQRRHHAIGKILGEAFDCRAAHRGLVERGGLAADNPRHGAPSGLDAVLFQRRRHGGDVCIEAALRQQARGRAASAASTRKR